MVSIEFSPIIVVIRIRQDGKPIYIGTLSKNVYVEINRVFYEETFDEKKDEKGNVVLTRNRKIYEIAEASDSYELTQSIRILSHQNPKHPILIQYPNNSLNFKKRSASSFELVKPTPVSYIPTQFLSMDLLASLWDQAVLTSYFDNVRQFLKIISTNFEDIAFVKVNNPHRKVPNSSGMANIERTSIVKLSHLDSRIPLNGMGDGVLRILQLVLGIFPATNGFLLIDEARKWFAFFYAGTNLEINV